MAKSTNQVANPAALVGTAADVASHGPIDPCLLTSCICLVDPTDNKIKACLHVENGEPCVCLMVAGAPKHVKVADILALVDPVT